MKIFQATLLGCVVVGFSSAASAQVSASNLAFNQLTSLSGMRLVVDEQSMPDGETYGGENAQDESKSPDAYADTDEHHDEAEANERQEQMHDSENNDNADQDLNIDEGDE